MSVYIIKYCCVLYIKAVPISPTSAGTKLPQTMSTPSLDSSFVFVRTDSDPETAPEETTDQVG